MIGIYERDPKVDWPCLLVWFVLMVIFFSVLWSVQPKVGKSAILIDGRLFGRNTGGVIKVPEEKWMGKYASASVEASCPDLPKGWSISVDRKRYKRFDRRSSQYLLLDAGVNDVVIYDDEGKTYSRQTFTLLPRKKTASSK